MGFFIYLNSRKKVLFFTAAIIRNVIQIYLNENITIITYQFTFRLIYIRDYHVVLVIGRIGLIVHINIYIP